MTTLEEQRRRRTLFMNALYDEAGGSAAEFVNGDQLAETRYGWSILETRKVTGYLKGEGLLHSSGSGGLISITHQGIKEVEAAKSSPDIGTEHFIPHMLVFTGDITNSNVQAGTVASTQIGVVQIRSIDEEVVALFLTALRSALESEPPSDLVKKRDTEELLVLAEAQQGSAQPNEPLRKAVLRGLRDLVLGMTASGAWAGVVTLAHQLPH